jgi:penicillin-binding protein 2
MGDNRSQIGNVDFGSMSRAVIFKGLVVLIALMYIGRLGYLQIIRGSFFLTESEAQAIKQEVIEPFRGNMFDRNGELLVHNEPSFTVKLTPSDFDPERFPLLASLLQMDPNEIKKTLNTYKDFSRFEPVKIARDIDRSKALLIEEYLDYLPGIDVSIESKRLYDFAGTMSHLFGYTREISREDLKKMNYYKPGDIIGKTGLESTYEPFLCGTKGIKYIAVNRGGQKVASFNNGKSDELVGNGFDLHLAIHKKTQEIATEKMEGRRGTLIAIDPNNGEIIAYVSKPDFDLKDMSGKVKPEVYAQLRDDEGKPLMNRGIQAAYPPGSTWKILVALAAMQEGLITENTVLNCNKIFYYGNRPYKCHTAHGALTVRSAIKASCNVFFYQLGLRLGLERMAKYAEMFGFGQKTSIDIPNELSGFYPSPEALEKRFGKAALNYKGRLVNYGIGQGEINVTPMQMAVYLAAIANKGTIIQPHVARDIYNNKTGQMHKVDFSSHELPISKHLFDVVHSGMYDVVNSPGGTGYTPFAPYRQYLSDYQVYGKTGTAQNPHGKDHSWFICFATKNGKPVIAIVAMVENAGFGATVAAPMVFQALSTYLNPKFGNVELVDPQTQGGSVDHSETPD